MGGQKEQGVDVGKRIKTFFQFEMSFGRESLGAAASEYSWQAGERTIRAAKFYDMK